jgi:hypothetical protein
MTPPGRVPAFIVEMLVVIDEVKLVQVGDVNE